MSTTSHTRRSGRMYPHYGPTMPTRTRSAAHAPATRRTTVNPSQPEGKGVHASTTNPLPTSSGSSLSLPGVGTPSRGRA